MREVDVVAAQRGGHELSRSFSVTRNAKHVFAWHGDNLILKDLIP
jgi:hypothetical protein